MHMNNNHSVTDLLIGTSVCPGSSDPIHIVTYYIKWVTSSWTDGIFRTRLFLILVASEVFSMSVQPGLD